MRSARHTATSASDQRHPKRLAITGAITAVSMPPIGTPVCFREKRRLRRSDGVKRMSRCEADGVSRPYPRPRNIAEAKKNATCGPVAMTHPITRSVNATCCTRQAPQRVLRFPPNASATSIAAASRLIW